MGSEDKKQKRLWLRDLQDMKNEGKKIVLACPWDYNTAQIAEEAGVDVLVLGGPTPTMLLGGKPHALNASLDDVIKITKDVAAAVNKPVLLVSLTYGSFQVSNEQAVENAIKLIQSGAHCVKAQTPGQLIKRAEAIINAGIPFEGHVGLLPHLIYKRGGFRIQGKTAIEALEIYKDCKRLQDIGASCIEMECVPHKIATEISKRITIPIFGIGSGPGTDGQFLVMHDILGFQKTLNVKFVKKYANLWDICLDALQKASEDVRKSAFPAEEHTFSMDDKEFEKFMGEIDS